MQSIVLAKKHQFTGPESFEEINAVDFLTIIRVQRTVKGQELQAMELCKLIFKIPARLINKLNTIQVMQLTAICNFMYVPAIRFDQWIIKSLSSLNLYGPGNALENICFDELMHADQALDDFKNSRDEKYLDQLIAILFREKASAKNQLDTGDIRVPFNKNHIASRAETVSSAIDIDTKHAVRFNYIACRCLMSGYFPHLFPEPDEDEPQDKSASNAKWLDVAINLARKEPVLGNFHDIERDNAYLVLKILDSVIKEHQEHLAEIEKHK